MERSIRDVSTSTLHALLRAGNDDEFTKEEIRAELKRRNTQAWAEARLGEKEEDICIE